MKKIQPVTLFTGQWGDVPLKELSEKAAKWGYEGFELSAKGDHLDIERAAESKDYCDEKKGLLQSFGLNTWSVSNHRCGQLVADLNDERNDAFVAPALRGNPEAKRAYGIDQMKKTAKAARNLGVEIVTGFTGSPIWNYLYRFPAVDEAAIRDGYQFFAKQWNPILDVFGEYGVRFALEVHPAQIAYDIHTAERTLEAIGNRPEFGFNFDPSHLFWQMMDPVQFIRAFPERIYHVHVKDCALTLDGKSSILSSHINFGGRGRGWDFRSAGHGQVKFEEIFGELYAICYTGPLSVEWEDSRMEREWGAADACAYVRKNHFPPSTMSLDAALGNKS